MLFFIDGGCSGKTIWARVYGWEVIRMNRDAVNQNDLYEQDSVLTDLAVEAREMLTTDRPPEIPGVDMDIEKGENAEITRIVISSDEGSRLMGKVKGSYSTIQAPALRERDQKAQKEVGQALAKELKRYVDQLGAEDTVLVVGLGNWNATPDALGPRVVHELLVTRHLYNFSPPELRGGLRPVAAIAPGVLGLTGIETGEIVKGLVGTVKPGMVICVDALAARNSRRLCTTIQISDVGIHPGSGVGNKRFAITSDTLGLPVIAVGVPTVIHAATLINDGMQLLTQVQAGQEPRIRDNELPESTRFDVDARYLLRPEGDSKEEPEQRRMVVRDVLDPFFGTMIVTPKEIDVLIEDVAQVVAGGLNTALNEHVDLTEITEYLS